MNIIVNAQNQNSDDVGHLLDEPLVTEDMKQNSQRDKSGDGGPQGPLQSQSPRMSIRPNTAGQQIGAYTRSKNKRFNRFMSPPGKLQEVTSAATFDFAKTRQ